MATCLQHTHEIAEAICKTCGANFCADCLVYPFGASKPPLCIPCAINASGVRHGAGNPVRVEPKEKKARLKEWRKARKRNLGVPEPDGVAAWQQMDASDAADEEAASRTLAQQHEALLLPPPE